MWVRFLANNTKNNKGSDRPQRRQIKGGKSYSFSKSRRTSGFSANRNTVAPLTRMGYSVTAQNKDLRVVANDYLDWSPGSNQVLTYAFRDIQQFFQASGLGGAGLNISKLNRVSVWLLPRAVNAAVATSTVQTLYATPVVPSIAKTPGTEGAPVRLESQRNVTVNPTFNTTWVKVGMTDFDRLFKSSQVLPLRSDTADGSSTGWVAFQLSLINPDDASKFTDSVQLRVEIEFTQTLPVGTDLEVSSVYGAAFGAAPLPIYSRTYSMLELKSLNDSA